MCKTSSTEQSRATLHGAGAKTGAWTMEGKTTWCNKDSIPPETRRVQKEMTPSIRASGAQRFAAVLALPYNEDYMGRRRSCSTSALPHTRLRQVARLGVTHGFFAAPARSFAHSEGKESMALSQPRLLTKHFHTWQPSARPWQKTPPGAWHPFCAHPGTIFPLSLRIIFAAHAGLQRLSSVCR